MSPAENQFANSLDPDQTRQDIGPDLDPNCWTHSDHFPDFFLENFYFEINQQKTKYNEKLPIMQTV